MSEHFMPDLHYAEAKESFPPRSHQRARQAHFCHRTRSNNKLVRDQIIMENTPKTSAMESSQTERKKRATSLRKMVKSARKVMEQKSPKKGERSNVRGLGESSPCVNKETAEPKEPTRERKTKRQLNSLSRKSQCSQNHLRESLPYSIKGIPQFSGRCEDDDDEVSLGGVEQALPAKMQLGSAMDDSSWGTLCTSVGSGSFHNLSISSLALAGGNHSMAALEQQSSWGTLCTSCESDTFLPVNSSWGTLGGSVGSGSFRVLPPTLSLNVKSSRMR